MTLMNWSAAVFAIAAAVAGEPSVAWMSTSVWVVGASALILDFSWLLLSARFRSVLMPCTILGVSMSSA